MQNKDIRLFYNKVLREKFEDNYEHYRWFRTKRLWVDYVMMHETIRLHVGMLEKSFSRCIELGPGPGTWTRLLYRCAPEATFDLVDISKEMERQFRLEMRELAQVTYHVSDIMSFRPEQKCDLFFSSRAIEYLEDKDAFVNHLRTLMAPGGTGIIITKNPSYRRFVSEQKLDKARWQHTGQVSHTQLKIALESQGFSDIKSFPAIVRIPLLDRLSCWSSFKLFRWISGREINKKFLPFCESYVTTFRT